MNAYITVYREPPFTEEEYFQILAAVVKNGGKEHQVSSNARGDEVKFDVENVDVNSVFLSLDID